MKKVKITASIIAVSIIAILIFTNSKTPKSNSQDSGTLLWKITSENQTSPSYLYGTIHLLPEEDYFLGQDVVKCLQSAKSLTLEIDMDIPLKAQIKMAQRMMLPGGKTLKDYMNDEDYTKLHSYLLDSLSIKEGKIERYMKFKPFNLLAFACMEYYGDVKMYEQELTKIAKKNDLKINGLETIDEQFDALEKTGIDMLMPTENDIYILREYEKLKEVYLKKDINALTLFMKEELDKDKNANVEAQLLTDRNINWIPKIDSIVSNESSFIAVGAGHLGGEKGIINLLKENGYTLTPVN